MSPTVQFVPNPPTNYSEKISILLVTPNADDLASLQNILHHRDWNIAHCASVGEACTRMKNGTPSVVVTECNLPDGCWKDLLAEAESMPQAPLVLVTSRHADDRLWAEVLNLGGYDVLMKPFDRSEVARVVGMAWRCWAGAFRRARAGQTNLSPQYA